MVIKKDAIPAQNSITNKHSETIVLLHFVVANIFFLCFFFFFFFFFAFSLLLFPDTVFCSGFHECVKQEYT